MKLTTFALLAGASMTITSLVVWTVVPAKADVSPQPSLSQSDSKPVVAAESPHRTGEPSTVRTPDGSDFTSGGTVVLSGRLGHPVVAAGRSTESFLHFELAADPDPTATASAPVNLAIVMDRSGSMEGKRMRNALAAARGMIGRLRTGDTVSVVAYNTSTVVLVPPTNINDRTRGQVASGLTEIAARGHTCISCGIEAAMNLMSEREGAVNRMLLLSDGEANAGVRDVDGFRRLAGRARSMNASISSIGVDVDYNERTMFAVAQSSNGRHYFVENPSELGRVFDDELESLVSTAAAAAELSIELAPGVRLAEVYDRSFRREDHRIVVPFGNFAAGDRKSLLVRVRFDAGDQPHRSIAGVALTYHDLAEDRPGTCAGTLTASTTESAREVSELDPLVEGRLARAETAAALALANEQFSRGDALAAQQTLRDNRGRLRKRRSTTTRRSKTADRSKLDQDFERQLDAIEQADANFEQAIQESPAAPARSRKGKAQVRSNAGRLSDLSL